MALWLVVLGSTGAGAAARPGAAPAAGPATPDAGLRTGAHTGRPLPARPRADAAPGARRLGPGRAAPLPQDPPTPDTPEALWAAGARRAAIATLEAELAAGEADPTRRRRLVRWQLAVHAYEAALATAEAAAPTLDDLRGEALYALTRYDEALDHLEPSRPEHALLVVDANEALGRLDAARRALEAARAVLGADDPRLASFEGRALARAGRHAHAIGRFRDALAVDPLDQTALFGLGRALIANGEREAGLAALEEHRRRAPLIDALDFARQSLDIDPLHAPNMAAVGDAERALGRFGEALDHYDRALVHAAPDELAPVALRAARLLEEDLDRRDDALGVLGAAFERVRDVRLAVRAGDVARRAGEPDRARRWYLRGLELRPEDRAILERLRAVGGEQR